jgi:hypothetical protein
MTKIDVKKQLGPLYYASRKEAIVVEVPSLSFLMVDGSGDPNTAPAYRHAIEALYALSYALKFMVKRGEAAVDYTVMPLEGLWWSEDMADFDPGRNKDRWQWTAMILQPEIVTADLVDAARAEVGAKKDLPPLERLRFEPFEEGRAAQILHLGPYAGEAETIARLHTFIEARGGRRSGKHHEIYLSDPRRTAPDRLKTLIRQPFR